MFKASATIIDPSIYYLGGTHSTTCVSSNPTEKNLNNKSWYD